MTFHNCPCCFIVGTCVVTYLQCSVSAAIAVVAASAMQACWCKCYLCQHTLSTWHALLLLLFMPCRLRPARPLTVAFGDVHRTRGGTHEQLLSMLCQTRSRSIAAVRCMLHASGLSAVQQRQTTACNLRKVLLEM